MGARDACRLTLGFLCVPPAITWSSGWRYGWPSYPDRIADQLGIGVHQLVAFHLLSAYLFLTVFPWLFAYLHSTASHRHPLLPPLVSRIKLDGACYRRLQVRESPLRSSPAKHLAASTASTFGELLECRRDVSGEGKSWPAQTIVIVDGVGARAACAPAGPPESVETGGPCHAHSQRGAGRERDELKRSRGRGVSKRAALIWI